ncbi:hypothetical protein LguiB_020767 [Lonicera macranthoides]
MFEDEDCRRFEEMFATAYEQAKKKCNSLPSQMPNEKIEAQHHERFELEQEQQVLEQGVDELELKSCFPKKLMGFKTECGLFEWSVVGKLDLVGELRSMATVELDKFEKNAEINYGGKQEISKATIEARRIFAKGREDILAKEPKLEVGEVEHVDFISLARKDDPGSRH